MFIHNTPSVLLAVEKLGMNPRDIHVFLEKLAIWTLTTSYDGSVDTLNADVELVAHKAESGHSRIYERLGYFDVCS